MLFYNILIRFKSRLQTLHLPFRDGLASALWMIALLPDPNALDLKGTPHINGCKIYTYPHDLIATKAASKKL